MLDVGIIEPVEESKWIGPIVIQDKKTTGEVKICVKLKRLNDACLHDPFSTSFIDEVLESIEGKEMYSFTGDLSGYHQVRIAKEEHHKITFVREWGCYQYTVMPFRLKNAPAIFSRRVVSTFKYFIYKFIEIYFDDWTVSILERGHIDSLCMILGRCHQY